MKGTTIKNVRLFGLIVVCLIGSKVQSQEVTFTTIEEKMIKNPKPIVVFLHTNWCNYCALMEKKTFSNDAVQEALENKVYFISFDAETKEKIRFRNREFVYKKKGIQAGVHELAEALTIQNTYPALVIMDENYQIIYQHYAYVGPKEMLQLLNAL